MLTRTQVTVSDKCSFSQRWFAGLKATYEWLKQEIPNFKAVANLHPEDIFRERVSIL